MPDRSFYDDRGDMIQVTSQSFRVESENRLPRTYRPRPLVSSTKADNVVRKDLVCNGPAGRTRTPLDGVGIGKYLPV